MSSVLALLNIHGLVVPHKPAGCLLFAGAHLLVVEEAWEGVGVQGTGWGQDLPVSVGLCDTLGESEGPGQGL